MKSFNYNELINKKYNKLIILSIIKVKLDNPISARKTIPYAICLCDCGKFTTKKLTAITKNASNATKSCGCLILENAKKLTGSARKYSSLEAAARDVWNNFYKKNSDLSFDDFYKLSQENCFYCGSFPNNKSKSRNCEYNLGNTKNAVFIYNGLDRIDNSKPHNKNNIVASCHKCNWAKSDRNQEDFFKWIKNIILTKNEICNNSKYLNNINCLEKSAKCIWHNYRKNKKYDIISFEQFINISQQNCFYCNKEPSNLYKKKNTNSEIFIYNGLDRIDSNLFHSLDNCVPCCKYCNRAKLHMPMDDFYLLIDTIYNKHYGVL